MNNAYKLGDNYLLSFSIDFTQNNPIINMELFNSIERKETQIQYTLLNFNTQTKYNEGLFATKAGTPVMRLNNEPSKLNVNIEAILKSININKLQ